MAVRIDWMTNDPDMAKRLCRIDADYAAARIAASHLPLADKVAAYRAATEARREALRDLRKGETEY